MFCMFQVGFLICDPTVAKPDLLKDKFWDSVIPSQLPYTKVVLYCILSLCAIWMLTQIISTNSQMVDAKIIKLGNH